MATKLNVKATVNAEPVEFLCDPRQSLLECLRNILNLTGTKEGCNDGNCGACSVLLNGQLVNSCLVLGTEIDGQEVTTIEGLANWHGLHPLQQAFIENDALQCGFCTPGMLMAAKALLERNANPSEEQIRSFLAGNLCRCTGYDKIVRAVQDAAARLRGEAPRPLSGHGGANVVLATQEYQVVGTRPLRHDSVDKATGKAVFTADIKLPGMLYGKMLRSPYAHARILSIDTSKAEALPGVKAVVTARDMWATDGDGVEERKADVELKRFRDRFLASDKVLFVGHPVAAVAATDRFIAEEAVEFIDVRYEVLPPVMDVLEAMKDTSPRLHDDLFTESLGKRAQKPSNVAAHIRLLLGDPGKGFAESDLVVEREYRIPTVHQGYIETKIATTSWGADDTIRVWCSTQGIFLARDQVARALSHALSKVIVLPTETGGAFGGKVEILLEPVAALLARKAGRPVTLSMSRKEVLHASGPASGCCVKAKMGVSREGRILAVSAQLVYEAGCFRSDMATGAQCMFGAYDIPNGQIDAYNVVVNKPKSEAYRAPAVPQSTFAAETLIDEVCEKLGMDPLEFRLKNVAKEGSRQLDGVVLPRVGFVETIEAAMAHPHRSAPLGGPNRGRGIAGGWWPNYGGAATCSLKVNTDGTVSLATGSVDLQGTRTSIAMQAAEVLGMRVEDISSIVTDTNSTGYSSVTAGSKVTYCAGIAAIEAAQKALSEMRRRAGLMWQVDPSSVAYADGVFTTTADASLRLTFKEVAAKQMGTGGPIFASVAVKPGAAGSAMSIHIADVEVDPETGKVKLLRYTVVQDAGKAIHPSLVEGQMQGGAVQGIGYALYEGYQYDEEGHLRNDTLQDYRMPTILDVPMIDTVIVEVPNPGHPFGVRGVGETPIVPALATLANAVYHATGVRMRSLPLSPASILEKLGVIE